ncbi:MAG: hypothetical protein MUP03_08645 [Anaerolineales bacterium]|jgi:hypothetical protein|nr:hypothetical protein [Anaerolineales bacterium]
MVAVYRFLSTYEVLIYLIFSIGGLITLRWLWLVWREKREAVFGLEREFAQRRLISAFTTMLLILVMILSEFIISSFIIPVLPSSVLIPTATLTLLITPTGTITTDMATSFAKTLFAPQTAVPNGCVLNQVEITSPKSGQEVSGIVDLVGTVDIPNFGFYKYEIASQGSEEWSTISAGRNSVNNASLGTIYTKELTPGDYLLRLVVMDNQGQSLPPCIISIRVVGE